MTTELQTPGTESFVALQRLDADVQPACERADLACEQPAAWGFINHHGVARFTCQDCHDLICNVGYLCRTRPGHPGVDPDFIQWTRL